MSYHNHILSLQSAVMAGSVGNNAAMAIYNHFKLEAYCLDTVRLAAHPGYGEMGRDITSADTLDRLLSDFQHLPASDHLAIIQTGYLGAEEQVEVLAHHIAKMKDKNAVSYCLDPVMGDSGRLYIADSLADKMAQHLLPLADIITPNLFEFERLTQTRFTNAEQLTDTAQQLGETYGLKAILITGIPVDGAIADMLITSDNSTPFIHPVREQGFSGAGDVLTALFIAGLMGGKSYSEAAQDASRMVTACAAQADDPRDIAVRRWLADLN